MKIFATQSKISPSYILVLCLSFLAPQVSHAATNNLKQLISLVIEYMNYAIYLIIGLATLSFVWNVYRLYFVADADRTEAGKYVLFSVIGFFVMLSMWGLVNLVGGTLKLDNSAPGQPYGSGASTSGGVFQGYGDSPSTRGASYSQTAPTTGSSFQYTLPTNGAPIPGSTQTTGAGLRYSQPTTGSSNSAAQPTSGMQYDISSPTGGGTNTP